MNNIRNIALLVLLVSAITSCKKETLNVQQPVGLGGDVTAATNIDKWINDSLTNPYNIAVKYRWEPFNASLYKNLTPADENRVIPLLSALRTAWISPYNDETGSTLFMKKLTPKQLVLLGSVEYNNSTVLLGQAEGGNNITFYDVNQHFMSDRLVAGKFVMHTAHHEFAHILAQNVIYPTDFIGVSAKTGLAGYTATWYNVADADALQQGYISAYAMANAQEDFAEMVSIMLTEGKSKIEELKAMANVYARQALQQKEDYVVTYFQQVWNISFYSLQTKVQKALNALYPPPAVTDVFGYNLTYSTASVNPANTTLLPQPATFTAIFNAAKTNLAAFSSGGTSGRVLDSFDVYQYSPTAISVECYFHTATAATTPLLATYVYIYAKDANSVYTFTLAARDANGITFATPLAPLVNYISNNKFTITWYADPSVTLFPRVKFTPQAIPGSYFLARLLP